MKHVYMKQT